MKWMLLLLTAVSMSGAQAKTDKTADELLSDALANATDKIDCTNGKACAPAVSNLKCTRMSKIDGVKCEFTDSSGKVQQVRGSKAGPLFELLRKRSEFATYCKTNNECNNLLEAGDISCESVGKASCNIKVKSDDKAHGSPVQLITPEEATGGSGAGAH